MTQQWPELYTLNKSDSEANFTGVEINHTFVKYHNHSHFDSNSKDFSTNINKRNWIHIQVWLLHISTETITLITGLVKHMIRCYSWTCNYQSHHKSSDSLTNSWLIRVPFSVRIPKSNPTKSSSKPLWKYKTWWEDSPAAGSPMKACTAKVVRYIDINGWHGSTQLPNAVHIAIKRSCVDR